MFIRILNAFVMIKRGIVIKRIIERRSAKFYLRLQDGRELWIRNCHLLNTPEESYLGTCEFFCKQTEMFHYPIARLNILRSKRTMRNVYDPTPKKCTLEIYSNTI